MIKLKDINLLLTNIIGKPGKLTFEDRFVLSCILYSGIIAFISIFINIFMNISILSTIIVFLYFILNVLGFIVGRVYYLTEWAKIIFSISTFIFCDFYWLTNYGSKGSALYMILVYYSMMIIIWNNLELKIITLIVSINIILLFYLETSYPALIQNYPSEWARITDSYIGLLIFLGILSILSISSKNNYINQYKEAQKSDKLKSAFLANMSHEIRTPLNAIIGFSQLLSNREVEKEKKELFAKLIKENGKYLMKLVSDIMDVSLIETGQLKITNEHISLQSISTKLYHTFEHSINEMEKHKVKLILDIPENDVVIISDEVRLEQILSNLISNGIKFTKEGHVKFGYTIKENFILFYVEDTGIGIKEEFHPLIFSRFVKNEDSLETKFSQGAGIGLSLSKELVNILGGKIWFSSIYKQGSTFYFSLPYATETEQKQ